MEMTSLLVPQFDCLWSQHRESVFSLFWFGFKAISMIQMNRSAVIVSDCINTVYECVDAAEKLHFPHHDYVALGMAQSPFNLSSNGKQTQILLPPRNPVSVLNRFEMTQLDILAPTLPHIFNILALSSRQNTKSKIIAQ